MTKKIITNEKLEAEKMVDKKSFEKFIKEKIELIKGELLVAFIDMHTGFHYEEGDCPLVPKNTVFSINYQEEYKQAFISIHPDAYQLWIEDQKLVLINGLIHELSHIHTNVLGDMSQERYITQKEIISEVERVTVTVAEYIKKLIKVKGDKTGIYKLK